MFFLFILLLLLIILSIITIKIKIEIENLFFTSKSKEHLNKDYRIIIKIYSFYKIPILKIKITNDKIQKILNNKKIINKISKEKSKIIQNKGDIDKEVISTFKKINLKIQKIKLNINLGTEDAALTAILIPIISIIVSAFFKNKIKKIDENNMFLIQPIYINQNLINISLSSIFELKLIHIINTICIINKKRKGDKNERTSNRRSYDYGYE